MARMDELAMSCRFCSCASSFVCGGDRNLNKQKSKAPKRARAWWFGRMRRRRGRAEGVVHWVAVTSFFWRCASFDYILTPSTQEEAHPRPPDSDFETIHITI